MSSELAWWIIVVGFIVASVLGWRFRRGTYRGYVTQHRSSGDLAIWRNLPLVGPLLTTLVLPLVLLAAPAVFNLPLPSDTPRAVQEAVILAAWSFFFWLLVLASVFAYRPPAWLLPRWLREEDEAVGYVPPTPDSRDRAILLCGLAFTIPALAFMVLAFDSALGG